MMMMMPVVRLVGILLTLLLLTLSVSPAEELQLEDRKSWWKLGRKELNSALNRRLNCNVAKNVIVFVGDGMGVSTVTASRIYKGQKKGKAGEKGYMAWERFPDAALIKTYCATQQVPDSAATATALFCGVKTRFTSLGVAAEVETDDCAASLDPSNQLSSIVKWAQDAGLDTGLVTRTRVTDATPASLYAKSPNRFWQCDGALGEKGKGCKDIADQLVTDEPGRNMKVILGGGRFPMGAGVEEPTSEGDCARGDGRNLTQEWMTNKTLEGFQARYVTTAQQLKDTDAKNTDYLMGLFADDHLPFVVQQKADVPSLPTMTRKALDILKKSREGFFLLVEGGRIDHGLHINSPFAALEEALDFENALIEALKMVDEKETLIIVTADHSHTLTISGYPERGNDILGTTGDLEALDGLPMSTLMFANGPGFDGTFSVEEGKVVRQDPSQKNPRDLNFRSQVTVPRELETHGGEDVGLWAIGPMSHLFHRTHEQNYVAHVMAYAACIGDYTHQCKHPPHAICNRPHRRTRPATRQPDVRDNMVRDRVVGEGNDFPTADASFLRQLDLEEEQLVRLDKPLVMSPRAQRRRRDPSLPTDYFHGDL